MVHCHALNCRSNSANKIRLFRFPRDKSRRLLWLQNCGKTNLQVSESAKLCEYHFDETQYEQNRVDGWRKLKPNAVPTIFFHTADDVSSEVDSSSEVNLDISVCPASNNSASSENLLEISNTNQLDEVDSVSLNHNMPLKALEEIQRLKRVLHNERIRTESALKKNKALKKKLTATNLKRRQLRQTLKRSNDKYKTLLTKISKIPILKYCTQNLDNSKRKWFPENLKFA